MLTHDYGNLDESITLSMQDMKEGDVYAHSRAAESIARPTNGFPSLALAPKRHGGGECSFNLSLIPS